MQRFSLLFLIWVAQASTASAEGAGSRVYAEFSQLPFGKSQWLSIGLSQVITVFAYWVASNIVARENGGIGNALKMWLSYLLGFLGVTLISGLFLAFAVTQRAAALQLIAFGLWGILLLVVLFRVPMGIYQIDFPKALGLIFLAVIVTSAGQLALDRALKFPFAQQAVVINRLAKLPASDRSEFFNRLQQRVGKVANFTVKRPESALIAADKEVSLEQRHAALQNFYRELETRRMSLQPNDQPALDAYMADLAHYQELVSQLQADAAAAKPQQ